MDHDKAIDKFLSKCVKNHIDANASFDGLMFETYGKELDYVISKVDECKVASFVEGDGGEYLCSGYHVCNAIGYFITNDPITDEFIYTMPIPD